ncbi:hypothetical protein B0H13DRAFT_1880667 [Mycena leptocephala]|nr:hypothetical protein B0H13DRAFT_1880667 [Mycena leptocephala]
MPPQLFHGNISGESPNFDLDDIRPLWNRGPKGLDGFCKFFDYFLQIGFRVKCLQDPVLLLGHAIDIEFPAPISDSDIGAAGISLPLHIPEYQNFNDGPAEPVSTSYPFGLHGSSLPWGYQYSNLDIDSLDNGPVNPQKRCQGLKINFPPGKNAHTSYPFVHGSGLPSYGSLFACKTCRYCRALCRAASVSSIPDISERFRFKHDLTCLAFHQVELVNGHLNFSAVTCSDTLAETTLLAIPLSLLTIPGFIIIGPFADVGMGVGYDINAKGKFLARNNIGWSHMKAKLDISSP